MGASLLWNGYGGASGPWLAWAAPLGTALALALLYEKATEPTSRFTETRSALEREDRRRTTRACDECGEVPEEADLEHWEDPLGLLHSTCRTCTPPGHDRHLDEGRR